MFTIFVRSIRRKTKTNKTMKTIFVNIKEETVTFDHVNFSNFTESGLFENSGNCKTFTNEDDILHFYIEQGGFDVVFE